MITKHEYYVGGMSLVWGKIIRVANMLPAVIFAVVVAYIP